MMSPVARLARARAAGRKAAAGVGNAQSSFSGASAAGGAAPGAGTPPPAAPGVPGKPKYNPGKVLANLPKSGLLTPQQLKAEARADSVLETRPLIHGAKLLATQLEQEKAADAKGLAALGAQLQGGVSDTYKNIAESEAQNLARQNQLGAQLTQQSGAIAQAGSTELAGMQEGALGDYEKQLEMRGAPGAGGAQQALASAVANQQATQNADSQASQQFAASQGSSYGALASQMAGAAQMQGGAAVGQIGRDILSRVGQSNQKYNEKIGEALGKVADAKATRGVSFVKTLGELNEGNRTFKLGLDTVRGNKEGQKLKEKENAEAKAENAKKFNLELKEFGLSQWKAHHPNAGEHKTNEKKQELVKEVGNVKSIIGQLVGEAKAAEKEGNKGIASNFGAYVAAANKILGEEQAEPQVIRRVLQHWWENRDTGLSKDPNGPSLGR